MSEFVPCSGPQQRKQCEPSTPSQPEIAVIADQQDTMAGGDHGITEMGIPGVRQWAENRQIRPSKKAPVVFLKRMKARGRDPTNVELRMHARQRPHLVALVEIPKRPNVDLRARRRQ